MSHWWFLIISKINLHHSTRDIWAWSFPLSHHRKCALQDWQAGMPKTLSEETKLSLSWAYSKIPSLTDNTSFWKLSGFDRMSTFCWGEQSAKKTMLKKIATGLNRKGNELQENYSYTFFLFCKYNNFDNDQLKQLMKSSAALSKLSPHSSSLSVQKSNL